MTTNAELVMVGTELLLGGIDDTNATYLSRELAALGINLFYKSTVGDNWLRLIGVLSHALIRSDLVITSGGIGPTMDDITREAVAAVLGVPLQEEQASARRIKDFFAQINRPMTESNLKQALLPQGAKLIPNQWGTAPGFICEHKGKVVISLPGVPNELKGMFAQTVGPYLAGLGDDGVLVSRVLNFVGIGESALEDMVKEEITEQTNPTIAPYASPGAVKLRLTAKASNEGEAWQLIEPVEQRIREIAGQWLYGVGNQSLAEAVGLRLNSTNQTITTAESCTGGLIAHRLTNVPGSSGYFVRGYVTYSNQAKISDLGVDPKILETHGAVSAETAVAMASGARRQGASDWGLAVTGIAGPGGGSIDKPVGLVHMAIACDGYTKAEVHQFRGDREAIKFRTSQAALDLLRRNL